MNTLFLMVIVNSVLTLILTVTVIVHENELYKNRDK